MLIDHLSVNRFRNISSASLKLDHVTLLYGDNGSGKTSVLEAIHILGNGKSFRGNTFDSIINESSEDLMVFATVDTSKVGIQRYRNGSTQIKLNGRPISKVSELAKLLPVHLVEPNSVTLIEGPPTERRRFLDFTMFHVEHRFLKVYREFQSVLKQRNALLKTFPVDLKQLDYWDHIYIDKAFALTEIRKDIYSNIIKEGIEEAFDYLIPGLDVSHELIDGCKRSCDVSVLEEIIKSNRHTDIKYKSSQIGPHRADILFKLNGNLAKDYLSRGQKKLVTYGVRLAPALMLAKQNKQSGIVLIDDMPSELDVHSVNRVCDLVNAIGSQTVLTSVDKNNEQTKSIIQSLEPAMFHVEHGAVQPI